MLACFSTACGYSLKVLKSEMPTSPKRRWALVRSNRAQGFTLSALGACCLEVADRRCSAAAVGDDLDNPFRFCGKLAAMTARPGRSTVIERTAVDARTCLRVFREICHVQVLLVVRIPGLTCSLLYKRDYNFILTYYCQKVKD